MTLARRALVFRVDRQTLSEFDGVFQAIVPQLTFDSVVRGRATATIEAVVVER